VVVLQIRHIFCFLVKSMSAWNILPLWLVFRLIRRVFIGV
jgi:hypothetical protein